MVADRLARRAGVACSCRRRSRTSSPRPRIGSSVSTSSGSVRKTCSISSSTLAVSRPSDSRLGASGQKLGSSGSEASTACIDADDLAEPADAAEEAVRAPRRARRARAPSRPARSGRTPGGSRASPRAAARRTSTSRRAAAMFAKPCSVRKRSISSSGFSPGSSRRNTFRIERVVEDDRAVRLLGADRPRGRELRAQAGEALDVVELDRRVARRPLRLAGADQVHELAARRRARLQAVEPPRRRAAGRPRASLRGRRSRAAPSVRPGQLDAVDDPAARDLPALRRRTSAARRRTRSGRARRAFIRRPSSAGTRRSRAARA